MIASAARIDITKSQGYASLRKAFDRDYARDRGFQNGERPFHDYEAKLKWIIERAEHYEAALGLDPSDVLGGFLVDDRLVPQAFTAGQFTRKLFPQ